MASGDLRPGGTRAEEPSQVGSPGRQPGGAGCRQPGWQHVATYGDQGFGVGRPGLSRLVAEAPGRVDLVVVDEYGRLSPNRREQSALAAQLGGAGVRVVVVRPSPGRGLARMVANLALADMIGEAAR